MNTPKKGLGIDLIELGIKKITEYETFTIEWFSFIINDV